MKEHPIIFSAEMVRAILDGRKTQTRRVFKDAPDGLQAGRYPVWPEHEGLPPSPYGYPGDRLWVRETWATIKEYDPLPPSKIPIYDYLPSLYYAEWTGAARNSPNRGKWRPSIFMPRWASRITLEIISIRIERIQDISRQDVVAEGIGQFTFARGVLADNPPDRRWKFIELWNTINAKRGYGWDTNPCVRVYEFTVNQ